MWWACITECAEPLHPRGETPARRAVAEVWGEFCRAAFETCKLVNFTTFRRYGSAV